MTDMGDQISRLRARVDELEVRSRRSLPLLTVVALLFVPVFSIVEPGEDAAADARRVLLARLIVDSGAEDKLGVVIWIAAAVTILGLIAAVLLTLRRLGDPDPNRAASASAGVALAGSIVLYLVVVANNDSGFFGTDIYQPRFTYVLVPAIAIWLAIVNSEASRPRLDPHVDWSA